MGLTMITLYQMAQLFPLLTADKCEEYLPFINATLDRYEINTPKRLAAFFAQIGHESEDCTKFLEGASGKEYDPPSHAAHLLGNTMQGDGPRFKGRGAIQITGRTNYASATSALGIDLVNSPELAETPSVAFLVAGWFWWSRKLNALADTDQFDHITLRINGGYNGKPDRDRRWLIAKRVFGVADKTLQA